MPLLNARTPGKLSAAGGRQLATLALAHARNQSLEDYIWILQFPLVI